MIAEVTWPEANQRYLVAALAEVRALLEGDPEGSGEPTERTAPDAIQPWNDTMPRPALEALCSIFGLSPFERDLLLLCAGVEFDSSFAGLCTRAHDDAGKPYPTFSLALASLREPHWSALTPDRPLRYWRLLEIGTGTALTNSPLRIDERILHYLAGVQHLDERLIGMVEPLPAAESVPSQQQLAQLIAGSWGRTGNEPPAVLLHGPDVAGKRAVAAHACALLDLNAYLMSADAVPAPPGEIEALVRIWEREVILSSAALLLDCDTVDTADLSRLGPIVRLIERVRGPLFVTSREPLRAPGRPSLALAVAGPTPAEQRVLWESALQPAGFDLNGTVDSLVTHFDLGAPAIRSASTEVEGRMQGRPDADAHDLLWEACRMQARPGLDSLAERIVPAASWEDLVLPAGQKAALREIAGQVRRRATVYERWGFARQGGRGLGISALFAGASGTGKTLAAEVLAGELRLDLYRIDLSGVVSKYIGETEKNLRRVFDAAEGGGAILLFDEADALFGKRSEVKDSHDRYANIEVSYLLQRMEAYRGLAILTTNLKSALDPAFLRRIRFIVPFPFPDEGQRAEIWSRVFPQEMPCDGLRVEKLAKLSVPGGSIRNIALNAAFLAADNAEPVRMAHLLQAARSEYSKLERPLTEAEIGGWV
jgi:hypothetical protein